MMKLKLLNHIQFKMKKSFVCSVLCLSVICGMHAFAGTNSDFNPNVRHEAGVLQIKMMNHFENETDIPESGMLPAKHVSFSDACRLVLTNINLHHKLPFDAAESGQYDCKADTAVPGNPARDFDSNIFDSAGIPDSSEMGQIDSYKNLYSGSEDIKIYPNPFTDYLIIEQSAGERVRVRYSLYDKDGKLIIEGYLDENGRAVPLNELDKGTYILNIDYRGRTLNYKILKEK